MTVSFVGAQGAAAATVTIPAHQVGDLILIFAYRDGSNTVPTAPTAGGTVPTWTQIGSSGANTNSSRLHYATATATNTTSGTWTSATELICLVYRGASIGASAGGSGSATTSIAYPALTLQRTDNSSWVVGVAGHRTATNVEVAPTGMTNRASSGTEAAGHDTNGTVTSWTQQTVTVNASSAFRSWTVELRDKTVSLLADVRAFTVTRNDANLAKGRNLVADKGTFTITRNDANLYHNVRLTADVRAFTVASVGAGVLHNAKLGGDLGKFFLPERNLAKWSEQFENGYWFKNSVGTALPPVVTANHAVAPDGTLTADRIVFDTNGSTTANDRSDLQTLDPPTTVGKTYIFSVWIKTTDGSSIALQLSHSGASVSYVTVTGSWQRFTSLSNTAADTLRYPRLSLRVGTPSSTYASLHVWGFQWEEGTSITDYDPTGPAGATANDLRLTRRLVAETRIFSVNSVGAGVRVTHLITAETRSFTVTGNDATISKVVSRTLSAATGAFTVTRNPASLVVTRRLTAATRLFSVIGVPAAISKPSRLFAATRAFNVNGIGADIIYSGGNTSGKSLYFQSVVADPRRTLVSTGSAEDQLVYYVKGFYRIL